MALVADAEGFNAHRRLHKSIHFGKDVKVRRSPQAVACRKRDVEELGRPQTFLPWKTSVHSIQLLRHGRGNPDTAKEPPTDYRASSRHSQPRASALAAGRITELPRACGVIRESAEMWNRTGSRPAASHANS